jgi:ABC-2 type transport system ATP-binding protein
VRGVSFDIYRGEIFSLLGPNGAGKTTIISVLSCLLEPTEGDATVAGYSVTEQPNEVKRRIGVVPQDLAIYPSLTARQNLEFWGQMYGMGGAELRERAMEVLEQVGLAERADSRVDTYSGGMKRRVNIAVGLLHRPEMLYLDEPTVGIDPQSRRSILDLVKELNAAGMTVLYTTHYMEEAQELSDRVGIIDHGKLIAIGTQEELTRQVGEHDTLYIELDQEVEGIAGALAALPAVHEVNREGDRLMILAEDANRALPGIIRECNQHGVRVQRIEIQAPNLETLFLHLTGRALRD